MFKKIALALCALALVVSTGCRHKQCCQKASVSSSGCCPTSAAPPAGFLPPG